MSPDNLIEVVEWCMSLDPLSRPQSVFANFPAGSSFTFDGTASIRIPRQTTGTPGAFVGEGGATVRLWDAVTGRELRSLSGGAAEVPFLAFSPEREDPGNHSFSTRQIPKLAAGLPSRGWPTLRGSKSVRRDQPWDENSPMVARLRELGCTLAQGYFLGQPAMANESDTLVRRMGQRARPTVVHL